jgi:XTP/dITP diphosphohydrolase
MNLVFATNNLNKLHEVRSIFSFPVFSLKDIKCNEELPETQNTIEGNALQKAKYIYDNYKQNCFADDTGLEIESLEGRPGVYSARYAGPQCSAEDNIKKILLEMNGIQNRKAVFKTVIALIIDGKSYLFEGIIQGKIAEQKKGNAGFGYDPIFIPEGFNSSFAEMSLDEKNKISHRALAIKKLNEFFTN